MIKPVLLCAVILFTAAQFAASSRIRIATSPGNPCPRERNGLLCFMLQQFVSSGIITRVENLTLELEPGVHVLGSTLSLSVRKNLEIIGDNSTIVCTHGYSSYSLYIQSTQNVNISGITFVNCSRVYFYYTSRAIISRSNFHGRFSIGLELSYTTASVHSCSFVGKSTGMHIYQPSANISIDSCTFIGNHHGIYHRRSRNILIDSCLFVGNCQSIYLPSDNYRGTARINNCTFRDNGLISYSGSAVYCNHCKRNSLMIAQSTFFNNTASNGVIFFSNSNYHFTQVLSMDRCTFINNMASGRGGVLYLNFRINSRYSRMCSISRSVFINNRATVSGGAIYAIGNLSVADSLFGYSSAPQCAVIETRSSTSQNFYTRVALMSSTFLYNRAINSNISSVNNNNNFIVGGVACFNNSMVTVNNNTFSHNAATLGGGVMTVENSNITISRSLFYNNTAGVDGGALYTPLSSSNYTVTESSFSYNHAGDDGGAVFIGGAGSRVEISRSTFSHNTAVDRAGAIIVFRGSFGVTQTNMFGNRANSGNDVGICGSSISTSTSTYFSFHFRSQTPSSECIFYGDFRGIFPLPSPEDRSNMNIAHYLQIPGAVGNTTFIAAPGSSVVSTTSSTTTTEDQSLKEIQSKLHETSIVTYTFFSIVVLLVAILVVIIAMKFCLKKNGKYNLSTKNGHGASESSHYNDSNIVEIYEEPEGPTSAIKLKLNAVYSKDSV